MKINQLLRHSSRSFFSIKRPSELNETHKNYNFEQEKQYNQKIIKAKQQREDIKKRAELLKAESIKFLKVTDFKGLALIHFPVFCDIFIGK